MKQYKIKGNLTILITFDMQIGLNLHRKFKDYPWNYLISTLWNPLERFDLELNIREHIRK